jgi:uncharacterized membrane protein
MRETVLQSLQSLPPEWTTFIVAMLPIIELRGAIPFAIGVGVSWPKAYLLSVTGNLIPVVPLLLFLGPVSEWLRQLPAFGRFFDWLFARTRRRSVLIQRYGPIGLALFVAIPLPITGGWTGAAAAYLFGFRFRRSFPAIALGVLVAGVVVTLATKGVIGLGGLFVGHGAP